MTPPPRPETLSGWFRENGLKLAIVGAVLAFILQRLHPLDLLLAGGGLSLIIFLHELGHFAAAKLCDVHVKTFSIGFGPALPFCRFQYGETTYKFAMIPLGGYVAMVGEGDEEGDVVEGEPDPEVAAGDPRSFKNKSVFQRMFIISAGVIMNLVLAFACFLAAYLHGVQELPAVASHVESGSAAWRAGIHSGSEITRINGRVRPWFDDIRPIVSSTSAGETVDLELEYAGHKSTMTIEPLRPEGVLFPQLGIRPPDKLTLRSTKRDEVPPYAPGSPASKASAGGAAGFRPGDAIVAMSDPDRPGEVTPLDPKPNGLPGAYFDYHRRLMKWAADPTTAKVPVTVHVERKDAPGIPVPLVVPPAFRKDVGLRMRMGAVAAVRADSPAAKAGVQARVADGEQVTVPGDRIVQVQVRDPNDANSFLRWGAGGTAAGVPIEDHTTLYPLDPLRLPAELDRWADRMAKATSPDFGVTVTVLRIKDGDHTEKPDQLRMTWDPSFRFDLARPTSPSSPVPVSGLGLAYHVSAVVDAVAPDSPAAKAGLQPNDRVTAVRFKATSPLDGKVSDSNWEDVRPHHWAFVDFLLQAMAPHEFAAKVERPGGDPLEVTLAATDDPTWAVPELGLHFAPDTREQKADGLVDALEMGAHRTTRKIKEIYLGLYAIVAGRISVKMMSGPITLARASYIIAGEDFWHLLLWIGLISVNLAVVNFLPIPVLDGGHMAFLLYEAIRGKPAPDWFQGLLTWAGLALVLVLMLFVLGLDVWRLVM